jgi:replicative DNA helicase
VLLLCQLNRGVESRTDKRPVLSDLRDSGRIEEDADLVIALYRDEYHNPNGPLCGYVELLIRKARDGELGTAWARAKLANMRMESCDEPERPAQPTGNADRATGFQARSAGSRKPQAVS